MGEVGLALDGLQYRCPLSHRGVTAAAPQAAYATAGDETRRHSEQDEDPDHRYRKEREQLPPRQLRLELYNEPEFRLAITRLVELVMGSLGHRVSTWPQEPSQPDGLQTSPYQGKGEAAVWWAHRLEP